ncbi:hypothetical protein FRC02_008718 [Tulasnella sp. 418]|nr:hypothetical protein FRC02_008718 [Tulasnella sp. 418]
MLWLAPTTATLSVILGYASITCWLGAQFPQIITNIQRQSVEGLALPFLANWLFGDISNLVGCVLTGQLPFQTYLASYFCIVDVCLVGQFIYYSPFIWKSRKPPKESTPPSSPRRLSIAYEHSSVAATSTPQLLALSQAAANVATAAAHVAYEREASISRRQARSRTSESKSPVRHRNRATSISATRDHDLEEENGDEITELHESFHSEDGRGKRVSWFKKGTMMSPTSEDLPFPSHLPSSSEQGPEPPTSPELSATLYHTRTASTSRGRALTRDLYEAPPATSQTEGFFPPREGRQPLPRPVLPPLEIPPADVEALVERAHSRKPSSRSRVRTPNAAKRGASIVFLGVWAFFSWSYRKDDGGNVKIAPYNSWMNKKHVDTSVGQVLSPIAPLHAPSSDIPSSSYDIVYFNQDESDSSPPHKPRRRPEQSTKRIIGRISAWTCTILYLTSRLPQIWKNFVRKSVDGLSITLFIAAFLGNTFYVLSIMTNPILNKPPPISTDYLTETLPYLLGSGGTLMFDITIISQSLIYRGNSPKHARRSSLSGRSVHAPRSRQASRMIYSVEEEALLGTPDETETIRQKDYGSVRGSGT